MGFAEAGLDEPAASKEIAAVVAKRICRSDLICDALSR